jgi:DNA-binding CsgD family transcriptional regulator
MESRQTGLTQSERALLRALLQGYGLRQVAWARGETAAQTLSDLRRVLIRLTVTARPARTTPEPRPQRH